MALAYSQTPLRIPYAYLFFISLYFGLCHFGLSLSFLIATQY